MDYVDITVIVLCLGGIFCNLYTGPIRGILRQLQITKEHDLRLCCSVHAYLSVMMAQSKDRSLNFNQAMHLGKYLRTLYPEHIEAKIMTAIVVCALCSPDVYRVSGDLTYLAITARGMALYGVGVKATSSSYMATRLNYAMNYKLEL